MAKINRIKPDNQAEGDHTTFLEDFIGRIIKYATYLKNKLNPNGFEEIKRVDLYGGSHYNKVTEEKIPTPHVHEDSAIGEIRNANDNEIPRRNKKYDTE
jgi:hypothetical protein